MLIYLFRFLVFAAIYAGSVLWWAGREGGHGAIRIFAGGFILSGGAVAGWLASQISGRYIGNAGARYAAHVVTTAGCFVGFGVVTLVLLQFSVWNEREFVQPFVAIAAGSALGDGAIGLWHDRRDSPAHG